VFSETFSFVLPRPIAELVEHAVKAQVLEKLPSIILWAIEKEQAALLARMTEARRALKMPTWTEDERRAKHVYVHVVIPAEPKPPAPAWDAKHPGWQQARLRKATEARA